MNRKIHGPAAQDKRKQPGLTLEEQIEKERNAIYWLCFANSQERQWQWQQDMESGYVKPLTQDELEREVEESNERLASLRQQLEIRNKSALAAPSRSRPNQELASEVILDDVALRTMRLKYLVEQYPHCPNRELCGHFDDHHISVPATWRDAGIKTWVEAYRRRSHTAKVNRYIYKLRHPRRKK